MARAFGITAKAWARWRRRARRPEGLRAKRHPGPTPGLSDEQLQQREAWVLPGAHRHRWRNRSWTAARVAELIERPVRQTYHPARVREFLKHRPGWAGQKPPREAREREDQEVERRPGDEFPRPVRAAIRRRATLIFLGESGLLDKPDIVAEDFPGSRPDSNPAGGGAKSGRLPNLAAESVEWSRDYVWEEWEQWQRRPDLLQAFVRETGPPGLLKAG